MSALYPVVQRTFETLGLILLGGSLMTIGVLVGMIALRILEVFVHGR